MTVTIHTLGCRLNAYESERMRAAAEAAGKRDLTIINSCAVTREAIRQSRQMIRRASRANPHHRIIATGCAAQIAPGDFLNMPEVDEIIDNGDKLHHFARPRPPAPARHAQQSRTRAVLKIQDGCDWRCTFCIIPQGRGASRSRAQTDIISEACALYDSGHIEITLTGVDITSYGKELAENIALGDLVEALLAQTPSRLKLRLSSLDPAAIDAKLFALLAQEERMQPHIHLSAQAGDDMILKRMRRRHRRADMVKLCADLRRQRRMTIGADLIAGFPTETEAMFANSKNLLDDCDIAFAHIFPFSAHPKTPAARMPQLAPSLIRARAEILRQTAKRRLEQFLDGEIGSCQNVLAETERSGRTDFYAQTRFRHVCQSGETLQMRMIAREETQLIAEPV